MKWFNFLKKPNVKIEKLEVPDFEEEENVTWESLEQRMLNLKSKYRESAETETANYFTKEIIRKIRLNRPLEIEILKRPFPDNLEDFTIGDMSLTLEELISRRSFELPIAIVYIEILEKCCLDFKVKFNSSIASLVKDTGI
ncbi:hypothetical protein [Paenibacillus polymyxa]|uniref:Uncharacterized protein n=1 Tax=Paenibacillus polymyxa TaxID=1406 RepID=A0AAE9L8C5_PAEPO|nr:hypothetical protein [Paenibacillus polymyxa]URJ50751.1 hypothetical protein MF626_000118 [Paenibacillus polymyxa]